MCAVIVYYKYQKDNNEQRELESTLNEAREESMDDNTMQFEPKVKIKARPNVFAEGDRLTYKEFCGFLDFNKNYIIDFDLLDKIHDISEMGYDLDVKEFYLYLNTQCYMDTMSVLTCKDHLTKFLKDALVDVIAVNNRNERIK